MIEVYICPHCEEDFEDFDDYFEHFTCCEEDEDE